VAEARELFSKAVAADPRYAPAVQGLADSYAAAWLEPTRFEVLRGEHQRPGILDRAATLARQAIELDPYLARAHATLAWILHWQYRRNEALAEMERARELNPNLVDGRFGLMLAHDGRAGWEGLTYVEPPIVGTNSRGLSTMTLMVGPCSAQALLCHGTLQCRTSRRGYGRQLAVS
jgi:tetratricopeptide (TPR) repeat protein